MAIARSGLTIINSTFTGNTKSELLTGILNNLVAAGWTNVLNSPTPSTVTVSVGTPCVVDLGTPALMSANTQVVFSTTGTLPTNVTAGTSYYVKSISGNTFTISSSVGGANINTSGSSSGTHTANFELLMQSQTTPSPQNLNIRHRFRDNGGYCVTISAEYYNGSVTVVAGSNDVNSGAFLLPGASKVFRIIAGAYYWWICVPGRYSTDKEFAFGGVPWLPDFLRGVELSAGWVVGQGFQDANSAGLITFRNGTSCSWKSNVPNQQLIFNGVLLGADYSGRGYNLAAGSCYLQPWGPSATSYNTGEASIKKFADGSFVSFDPWIAYSSIYNDLDPKVRGMMWDACFIMDNSPSGDTTATFDGNTWYCISNLQAPSLWVIIG